MVVIEIHRFGNSRYEKGYQRDNGSNSIDLVRTSPTFSRPRALLRPSGNITQLDLAFVFCRTALCRKHVWLVISDQASVTTNG